MRNGSTWIVPLTGIFAASIVTSNVIAAKLLHLPFGLAVPAGVFAFSITFLITDVVSELWGRQTAARLVWTGFGAALLSVVFIETARVWPAAVFWPHQAEFSLILGATPRITLASLLAYLVSQFHDVWAFHMWRQITRGRHLWLRNNLSTMTSQLLDSAVFITIAFGGILPWAQIPSIILSQYLVKVLIAAADTPFCYAAVALIRPSLAGSNGSTTSALR